LNEHLLQQNEHEVKKKKWQCLWWWLYA